MVGKIICQFEFQPLPSFQVTGNRNHFRIVGVGLLDKHVVLNPQRIAAHISEVMLHALVISQQGLNLTNLAFHFRIGGAFCKPDINQDFRSVVVGEKLDSHLLQADYRTAKQKQP